MLICEADKGWKSRVSEGLRCVLLDAPWLAIWDGKEPMSNMASLPSWNHIRSSSPVKNREEEGRRETKTTHSATWHVQYHRTCFKLHKIDPLTSKSFGKWLFWFSSKCQKKRTFLACQFTKHCKLKVIFHCFDVCLLSHLGIFTSNNKREQFLCYKCSV